MTDRLKLSDPSGDAEADRVAYVLEMNEHSARIKQLEKNIALLEAEAEKKKGSLREAPSGRNKIGARKEGTFKAISTAPSINKTPLGPSMVSIPYPTVQDLSSSVNAARSVKFNGAPAYLLDATTQPRCTGDEQGTGKGVKSGTVSGEVKPVSGSRTVHIERKQVVREGDACTMNGGNNPGIYVTTPSPSRSNPKKAIFTSNPASGKMHLESNENLREWDINNPLGLRQLSGIETLPLVRHQEILTLAQQRMSQRKASPTEQYLVPSPPNSSEARLQRTRNSVTIALLSVFGAPGAASRLLGSSEDKVAAANNVGAAAMGLVTSVAGMPHHKSPSLGIGAAQFTSRTTGLPGPPKNTAPRVTANNGVKVTSAHKPKDAFHATMSEKQAESILKGIDPKYLNPKSRFGKAFYVAEQPETALAEMKHYGMEPTTGIRFSMNKSAMRVLDLTKPDVAKAYGYVGGPITSATQSIGPAAIKDGFNVIRFYSERNPGGVNNAIINNYNEILTPEIVTPVNK